MSTTVTKQERFHFLDGLRGIASAMIVLHHLFSSNIVIFCDKHNLPVLSLFFKHFGGSGVELFFVLSGVVLLRPYLRRQRKFKVLEYFRRRIKRIYPPYFAALLFAAAVIGFNSTFATWYNVKGVHMSFSLYEIFRQAFIINLSGVYYNLSWWSLQIEILFYIIAPIIIVTFIAHEKITNSKLGILLITTFVASTTLQVSLSHLLPDYYSYNDMPFTLWRSVEYPLCFLLGVLLASKDFSIRHASFFIIAGVALIIGSWYYVPILHSGYGLIYAGIIILAFNKQSFRSILGKPFLLWLGERSYSLFLVHFSVIYLVNNLVSHIITERSTVYGLITRLLDIPLILLAAMLLFHLVERKFARGLVTSDMFWPWQTRILKQNAAAAVPEQISV